MTLTVNQLPIVDAGNDTFACNNQSFTLLPTIINANSYSWTPASFLDNPNSPYPNATITTKTQFWITVKNLTTGCTNKDSLWLDISSPTSKFIVSETSGDVPFTVHTTNQSVPLPMTYQWTFLDSVAFYSIEKDPSYTFNTTGNYKIVLQATDQYGCSAYDTLTVIARDVVLLFIPNAFTPNGDHSNEVFKPIYSSDLVKSIEATIWNRWGQVVYTSTMPGGNWWDGKSAGNISPEGVYVYQFKFTNMNNHTKIYNGTVTLLR